MNKTDENEKRKHAEIRARHEENVENDRKLG